jgi:hypothetical protein
MDTRLRPHWSPSHPQYCHELTSVAPFRPLEAESMLARPCVCMPSMKILPTPVDRWKSGARTGLPDSGSES